MAFGDFVQSAVSTNSSGSATTPTLGAAATAGNLLLLCYSRSATTTTFPTVSGFTPLTDLNSGNISNSWWYKIAAGGETTVSLSGESSGAGNWRMVLAEFVGPFEASPLDLTAEDESNKSTATTSQPSGTTGTTAQADELALAFFGAQQAVNVDGSRSYSNSFTERVFENGGSFSARAAVAIASRVLSSTGTYSTTFSCSDTGSAMYGAIATFKKESGVTIPDIRFSNPPTNIRIQPPMIGF